MPPSVRLAVEPLDDRTLPAGFGLVASGSLTDVAVTSAGLAAPNLVRFDYHPHRYHTAAGEILTRA